MKKILFSIFVLTICSTLAYSQDFKPEVKIGGTIYTGWEFNMDNAQFISRIDTTRPDANIPFGYNPTKNQFETSMNSFYLERSYINVLAFLTPQIKGRITPDVVTFTDGTGKTQYQLTLKYANLTYTPLQKESGMSLGFTLGILPNRWIEGAEKYWGYRGVAKTLTDYTFVTGASRSGVTVSKATSSYFSSADLGLDVGFTAPKGYAEIFASVLNGNGYRNLAFDNRFKDLLVTAYIHPLAGQITKKMDAAKINKKDRIDGITDLTVGGFGYFGKLDKGENTTVTAGNVGAQYQRNRLGGMAHIRLNFKNAGFLRIGGEFSLASNEDPSAVKPDSVMKTKSTGMSAYLEFNPPVKSIDEKLSLIARYDMFDPNTDNQSASINTFNDNTDKQSLLILGLMFKPNKVLTLGVSWQSTTYDENYIVKYDGTTSKTDARLLVHGILNF